MAADADAAPRVCRAEPDTVEQPGTPSNIRMATPEDAALLSEIAFRSKAYWRYDHEFMEACRAELTLSAAYFSTHQVFVLEVAGHAVGFYSVRQQDTTAELGTLFLEPHTIGHGYGRQLWQHALTTARQLGCHELLIDSDPHAEGFYRAMGAQRIGVSPSGSIPGRMVPLLRFELAQHATNAG